MKQNNKSAAESEGRRALSDRGEPWASSAGLPTGEKRASSRAAANSIRASPRALEEHAPGPIVASHTGRGKPKALRAPRSQANHAATTQRPLSLMAGKESARIHKQNKTKMAALRRTARERRSREIRVLFALARPSGDAAAGYKFGFRHFYVELGADNFRKGSL